MKSRASSFAAGLRHRLLVIHYLSPVQAAAASIRTLLSGGPEHGQHFEDTGRGGRAGQRDAERLSDLAELQPVCPANSRTASSSAFSLQSLAEAPAPAQASPSRHGRRVSAVRGPCRRRSAARQRGRRRQDCPRAQSGCARCFIRRGRARCARSRRRRQAEPSARGQHRAAAAQRLAFREGNAR